MVDETLKPALRLALRRHEIGGASFGFMQGDIAGIADATIASFVENPHNLPHMTQCAAAGAAILGSA